MLYVWNPKWYGMLSPNYMRPSHFTTRYSWRGDFVLFESM